MIRIKKIAVISCIIISTIFISSCEECNCIEPMPIEPEPQRIYEYTFSYKVYGSVVYMDTSFQKIYDKIYYADKLEDIKISDYYPLSFEDIEYYRTNHPYCNYYRSDTNYIPVGERYKNVATYQIITTTKEYHSYKVTK